MWQRQKLSPLTRTTACPTGPAETGPVSVSIRGHPYQRWSVNGIHPTLNRPPWGTDGTQPGPFCGASSTAHQKTLNRSVKTSERRKELFVVLNGDWLPLNENFHSDYEACVHRLLLSPFNTFRTAERGPCSANSTFVVLENTAKLKPVSKRTTFRWRERTLSLPTALF